MIVEKIRRPSMPSHRHPRVRPVLAVLASALLLVTACGRRTGSSTGTTVASTTTSVSTTSSAATTTPATTAAATTTTLDVAAAKAAITANWQTFFLPTTSIDDRVRLLERGESLRQALTQRAADPLMQQASAKVTAVELTGADRATVTYDVFLNGAPALTASQGTAVLEGGVWKVGADSFCALISLGATTPLPGCN
jgi:hypothetical protein